MCLVSRFQLLSVKRTTLASHYADIASTLWSPSEFLTLNAVISDHRTRYSEPQKPRTWPPGT